jgi:hypothetical protein
MNAATPPPLPKTRFEIPKSVLVIWLILFALANWLGVSMNFDARALGELCGRFVASTMISLLLSWLAWRLSSRSDGAKMTVLLVAFVLFNLSFVSDLVRRRSGIRRDQLTEFQDEARRIQEAQVEEFKKTGSVGPSSEATDRLISKMKEAGASGDDMSRNIMTAFADFLQKIRDQEAKHAQASDKLDSAWILEPTTARSTQEIAVLAGAVTNFMQVNQDFLAIFTNCTLMLTRDLKSKGIPASQIQSAIRGFETSFNPQLPFIKKIRQQDHKFGQALLEILDLYKIEHSKWKWDQENEIAAFSDKSSGERWLQLVDDVNVIGEEQRQTQAELIELRSKNLSRSPR